MENTADKHKSETNELTIVELNPKIDVVLTKLREHVDARGSYDAFVNSVLRTALNAQCKAAARLIRAKMGDGIQKWTTLGMTQEQIQAKQNDILRRSASLDALALELED